jgi:hypothetical protein
VKGFTVSVYRNAEYGDCTNGGVTKTANQVLLVGEGVPQMYEPESFPEMPVLKLVKRNLFGREYLHAEPIEPVRNGCVGYMAGGNFIYSCDSRFPSDYPIPVHDRQETTAQYEANSR